MTLYRNGDGSLIRNGDGSLATSSDCCCVDTECPCCYYAITILRDAGDALTVRHSSPTCTIGADTTMSALQCGNETFVLTPGAEDGCTCYATFASDIDYYDTDPCFQQFYTEAGMAQICNYNPPGPGTGQEIHIGTMSFREVLTVSLCYDPCGTVSVVINHKVYCNFGVYIFDTPPPLVGPVTHTWVDVSTDLIFDSTWTWTDIDAPNCETDFDIGPPTSETLAGDYTKTWGTGFINCGGSSSFTVTIPGACSATGLTLIGGGTPCDCE